MWMLVAACSSYEPLDVDEALESSASVEVVFERKFVYFEPADPVTEVGVVFYPGGLVQHESYAPPLRALAERGVPTALVSMASDLAVLSPNRADRVIDEVDLDRWVVAGHSLGGAMAGRYAEKNDVDGLVMWAAYVPGGTDLSETDLPVLSVTASNDAVLDWETYEERRAQLPESALHIDIEGGNHAGFANYGAQDGDGEASIPVMLQQSQTIEAMVTFIEGL